MLNLGQSYESYWLKPAPVLNLALTRIVIVAFQLVYMLLEHASDPVRSMSSNPDFLYQPVVAVWVLTTGQRASVSVLESLFVVTAAAGFLALIGLKTNVSLFAFAAGTLLLRGYSYSFGDWHHPDALITIALVLLAASPSGKHLSIDALSHAKLRHISRAGLISAVQQTDVYARWPLTLMQWLFAIVYFSAGIFKVRHGLEWLNGYTLQYYMLMDAMALSPGGSGSGFGLWIGQQHLLVQALSVLSLTFELTFVLAVLVPRLALAYVPAAIAFHSVIYLTMGAEFFQYYPLYSVFVPWTVVLTRLLSRTPRATDEATHPPTARTAPTQVAKQA